MANDNPLLPETGYIRLPQLRQIIPLGRSTIYRRIQKGTFPKQVKLGERTAAWRVEDIREWMQQVEAA